MKNFTKAGIVALAAAFAGVASAQTNGPTGISVRLGAVFPNTGDTLFAGGADYKFSNFSVDQARPGYLSYLGVSLDYYGKDSNRYNIPLALTYNIRANQAVFSAGVGVDFSRVPGRDSNANFGGQVGVAYEFGNADPALNRNPIFVQAKYFFTKESLNGLGVYVGIRF